MRTLGVMTVARALVLSCSPAGPCSATQLWASPTLGVARGGGAGAEALAADAAARRGAPPRRPARRGGRARSRRWSQPRPQEAPAYGKLGMCLLESEGSWTAAAGLRRAEGARSAQSPEASNGLATVALLAAPIDDARRGFSRHARYRSDEHRGAAGAGGDRGNRRAAIRRRRCAGAEEIRRLAPATPGNEECLSREPSGGPAAAMPSADAAAAPSSARARARSGRWSAPTSRCATTAPSAASCGRCSSRSRCSCC